MSVFIKSLHLENILSFRDTKLDLQPLNVLIGPNGSGKSNLIDVIGLLQAVPNDIAEFLRRNGPTRDWKWHGADDERTNICDTKIAGAVCNPVQPHLTLRYELQFDVSSERIRIVGEKLEDIETTAARERPHSYFRRPGTDNTILGPDVIGDATTWLHAIRDPINFPELTRTADNLSRIKVYRSWHVGRDSPVRNLQRTDGDPSFLAEDFSNLALVVNDLLSRRLEPSLNDYLKRFYESYESLHPRIFGNTIELIVNEAGLGSSLPASRLSDGTIRFIALLAILCHPEPPPLICIEEPEIAMHPDSQDLVVELLKKASERTQLIVTTHSPWLIDRLSAKPEQVLVCDRRPGEGTQFKRFTRAELEDWLEDQPLGEVWMAGALGGVH